MSPQPTKLEKACALQRATCKKQLVNEPANVRALVAAIAFQLCVFKETTANLRGVAVGSTLYREQLSNDEKKGVLLAMERCGLAAEFATLINARDKGRIGRTREYPIRQFVKESQIGWQFVFDNYEMQPEDRAIFLVGYAYGVGESAADVLKLILMLLDREALEPLRRALDQAPAHIKRFALFVLQAALDPRVLFVALANFVKAILVGFYEDLEADAQRYEDALLDLRFADAGRAFGLMTGKIISLLGGVKAAAQVAAKAGRTSLRLSVTSLQVARSRLAELRISAAELAALLEKPAPRITKLRDGRILLSTADGIGVATKVDGLVEWIEMKLPGLPVGKPLLATAGGPGYPGNLPRGPAGGGASTGHRASVAALRPRAPPPAFPIGSGPRPKFVWRDKLRDKLQRHTARTGGIIEVVGQHLSADGGALSVRIRGVILDALPDRGKPGGAPSYNKKQGWFGRAASDVSVKDYGGDVEVSLKGYQKSHLWGPRWGDEAADGMMYAPPDFNMKLVGTVEAKVEILRDQTAAQGGFVEVVATNTGFGPSRQVGLRQGENLLQRAEYEIRVSIPGRTDGLEMVMRIALECSHPLSGGRTILHPPVAGTLGDLWPE